ncbi:MAG: TetR/AcrR family transcriptional regulator [Tepidisphaeraceae bacterium]
MTHEGSNQMSRKDRERERHRSEILDAAERVFVSKGYEATTVGAVAKEAEFAVGTLYLFFKSKEELYGCVIQRIAEDFIEQFETRVLTRENAEEALAALIELRLTHFDNHQGFFRLVLTNSPGNQANPARVLPPQCRELNDRYIDAVARLFQQGISQGIFDRADPLYLALCLEGIINAFLAYWSRHPSTEPLPRRIAKMKREFIGRIKVHLEDES